MERPKPCSNVRENRLILAADGDISIFHPLLILRAGFAVVPRRIELSLRDEILLQQILFPSVLRQHESHRAGKVGCFCKVDLAYKETSAKIFRVKRAGVGVFLRSQPRFRAVLFDVEVFRQHIDAVGLACLCKLNLFFEIIPALYDAERRVALVPAAFVREDLQLAVLRVQPRERSLACRAVILAVDNLVTFVELFVEKSICNKPFCGDNNQPRAFLYRLALFDWLHDAVRLHLVSLVDDGLVDVPALFVARPIGEFEDLRVRLLIEDEPLVLSCVYVIRIVKAAHRVDCVVHD